MDGSVESSNREHDSLLGGGTIVTSISEIKRFIWQM